MRSILRREEVILLRTKYLPKLHEKYVALVNDLNMIAERTAADEDGDIWLTEQQQRRILRKLYRDGKALSIANNVLKAYLRQVFERLEEPLP